MNEKLDELYSIFKKLLVSTWKATPEFLTYLDYNKFKYQPASTKHHYACEGGLLVHSLNVYVELVKQWKLHFRTNGGVNLIIVSLLHDLCKIDDYIWSESENRYLHNPKSLPLGHGEKSVMLIQQYLKLDEEEMLAIRYHMGAFHSENNDKGFNSALDYPLVLLLHISDWISARITEIDFEKNVDKLLEELKE